MNCAQAVDWYFPNTDQDVQKEILEFFKTEAEIRTLAIRVMPEYKNWKARLEEELASKLLALS